MKKLLVALAFVLVINIALAADYTPVSSEGGKTAVAVTPTSNTEIAVVGGLVEMTAAAVSTNNTIASPVAEGVLLQLVNVGTNAVSVTDGTNIEGTGAMTMGQYDTLTLMSISATKWVELARSNN